MSDYTTNAQGQKKENNIRSPYISRVDHKIEDFRKLDNKVKLPGRVISCFLGVFGCLVMVSGMALVIELINTSLGIGLIILGMVIALLAYPIFALITERRKKKFVSKTTCLSDAVIAR